MIELKDINKTYKENELKALDDINLSFSGNGMVFIVGKSGCGKTTLLNIIGGLDEPSSGELFINGESTKNFTARDYDSYRNTLIGFVFQEYNVIEDFTVAENVKMAIELQGEKIQANELNNILHQVGLKDATNRKIKTLSGGQKQRVAIARALIKKPEIILADEPTGSLDSETGLQILELLKTISLTKLVIVVSHDIESAKKYADRIITLKDGQVLQDMQKADFNNILMNETQEIIDYSYSADGIFKKINAFLHNYNGSVTVTQSNNQLKFEKKIFKENSVNNKAEVKEETHSPLYLKKSKLPIKYAARLGLSNIKQKPIRSVFTVILTTFSLIVLTILFTLITFSESAVLSNALQSSDYDMLFYEKKYQSVNTANGSISTNDTYFSSYDLNVLQDSISSSVYGVYTFDNLTLKNNLTQDSKGFYYSLDINGIIETEQSNLDFLRNIYGTYPAKTNEIAITSYLFDSIQSTDSAFLTADGEKEINEYNDLIGQNIYIEGTNGTINYKITAILDIGDIPSTYDKLKSKFTLTDEEDLTLYNKYSDYMNNSLHKLIFVCDGFYETAKNQLNSNRADDDSIFQHINLSGEYHTQDLLYSNSFSYVSAFNKNNNYKFVYFNDAQLADEDIILSLFDFCILFNDYVLPNLNEYEEYSVDEYTEILNSIIYSFDDYSYEELSLMVNNLYACWATITDVSIVLDCNSTIYNISGLFIGNAFTDGAYSFFANEILYNSLIETRGAIYSTNYVESSENIYDYVLIEFNNNISVISKFVSINNDIQSDDSFIVMNNRIYSELKSISDILSEISQMTLIVGCCAIVFSALLFFYFISISIINKKKEIGIIRALGGRKIDIMKIFMVESLLISFVSVILSIIGALVSCNILNNYLIASGIIGIDILVVGFTPIGLTLMLALVVSFISTLIPLTIFARYTPVQILKS